MLFRSPPSHAELRMDLFGLGAVGSRDRDGVSLLHLFGRGFDWLQALLRERHLRANQLLLTGSA